MIDFTELEKKLETLTGHDFETAEKTERSVGNFSPDISFSKSFQIRLAAMAMGVNPQEIKALPMNKYNNVAQRVMNFLLVMVQVAQLRRNR